MDCIFVYGPQESRGFGLGEIERALEALCTEVPKHFNAKLEHIVVLAEPGVAKRAYEWAVLSKLVATTVPDTTKLLRFHPFAVATLPGHWGPEAPVSRLGPTLVWRAGAWTRWKDV